MLTGESVLEDNVRRQRIRVELWARAIATRMGAQPRLLIVGFHVAVGMTVLLMRESAFDF